MGFATTNMWVNKALSRYRCWPLMSGPSPSVNLNILRLSAENYILRRCPLPFIEGICRLIRFYSWNRVPHMIPLAVKGGRRPRSYILGWCPLLFIEGICWLIRFYSWNRVPHTIPLAVKGGRRPRSESWTNKGLFSNVVWTIVFII